MNLPTITIDSAFLFTAWGVLSSLMASYIPGFNTWFAALIDAKKRLIMFCGIIVIAGVAVILTYTGVWVLVPLTKEGILLLAIDIFLAISTNQGTYKITTPTRAVLAIKERKELARLVSLSKNGIVSG